ncbi:unnamed protein product [Ixodes hexagonus]
MIPALSMVPRGDAEDIFTELASSVDSVLQPVVDYFEDAFIGRPTARGRRDAQFPVELWNHHDTAPVRRQDHQLGGSMAQGLPGSCAVLPPVPLEVPGGSTKRRLPAAAPAYAT